MTERSYDTAASFVSMSDLIGHTVLVTPHEHIKEFETSIQGRKQMKDPIRADIVDLTDGEEYLDVMIFQGVLIATLKDRVPVVDANGEIITPGRQLLGRVYKAQGEPGENTPYKFLAPRRADIKLADAWLDGTYDDLMAATVPAAPAAPAAPAPVVPPAPAVPLDPSEDPFAV
jgi:hypothetical protein